MSLTSPAGPINPDEAPNYEEIEKQFAVKGEILPYLLHHTSTNLS